MANRRKKPTGGLMASMRSTAKIDNLEVNDIREAYDRGDSALELSRQYGICVEGIRRIGRRETYAWVPEIEEFKRRAEESVKRLHKLQEQEKINEASIPPNPFDNPDTYASEIESNSQAFLDAAQTELEKQAKKKKLSQP